MRRFLVMVLLMYIPFGAGAQGHNPHAADPAHPATQVATTVAEALLTVDVERAAAAIAAVATNEYRMGALEPETRALVDALEAPSAYGLQAVMLGPANGMIIVFRDAEDPTRTVAAVVEMEADAPHRVTGLRRVRLQSRARP